MTLIIVSKKFLMTDSDTESSIASSVSSRRLDHSIMPLRAILRGIIDRNGNWMPKFKKIETDPER